MKERGQTRGMPRVARGDRIIGQREVQMFADATGITPSMVEVTTHGTLTLRKEGPPKLREKSSDGPKLLDKPSTRV